MFLKPFSSCAISSLSVCLRKRGYLYFPSIDAYNVLAVIPRQYPLLGVSWNDCSHGMVTVKSAVTSDTSPPFSSHMPEPCLIFLRSASHDTCFCEYFGAVLQLAFLVLYLKESFKRWQDCSCNTIQLFQELSVPFSIHSSFPCTKGGRGQHCCTPQHQCPSRFSA